MNKSICICLRDSNFYEGREFKKEDGFIYAYNDYIGPNPVTIIHIFHDREIKFAFVI